MRSVSTEKPHQISSNDRRLHEARQELQHMYERLQARGLLEKCPASFSVRIPGTDHFAFLQLEAGAANEAECLIQDLSGLAEVTQIISWKTMQQNRLMNVHASVFHARPDAGAVAILNPLWSAALHWIKQPLPRIFDEQARQLGGVVQRLMFDPEGLVQAKGLLASGANAFLFDDGVLVCGVTREKTVFNVELLEKCARAYLLAYATGQTPRRLPWYVRWIARSRLLKDQRRAARAYARGEVPTGFKAY